VPERIIGEFLSIISTAPVKIQIFHLVLVLTISKFSTISSASQPAVKPGNTSAMAPDFSHKKGLVYVTVIPMKVHPLHHGFSFYPLLVSFLF